MANECVPTAEDMPAAPDPLLALPFHYIRRAYHAVMVCKMQRDAAADVFDFLIMPFNVSREIGVAVVLLDVIAVWTVPTLATDFNLGCRGRDLLLARRGVLQLGAARTRRAVLG